VVDAGNNNRETGRGPLVSIGMPVYNGEEYLREALDSLLGQDYEDFELIISDNASSDRTPDICQEYLQRDDRIRYVRQPENRGPSANFNFLLNEARGDFFMWAAADDVWDKHFISLLVNALVANPQCATAFGPYMFINESGNPLGNGRIRRPDYSARTGLGRLIKLCWYYDDGFFYGLHSLKRISDLKVPTWTSMGRVSQNPMNNAYPVLFYILSVGGFAFVESATPLWLNRILPETDYRRFQGSFIVVYFSFLSRKLNVLLKSMRSVYEGSSSLMLATALIPFLMMRFVFDSVGYWRGFRLQRVFHKAMNFTLGRNST
jgi:glycosyltransferase involved in cell wall biosynthesis